MSIRHAADNDWILGASALPGLSLILAPQQRQLLNHRIYGCLTGIAALRVFMQHHVFAVWDFMALLKALQRHLTCTGPLWRPVGDAASRRLINEMVLEEESDEIDGVPTSHFEVYLQAMRQVGADVRPIEDFLAELAAGSCVETAFARARVPAAARAFVRTTLAIVEGDKPHVICAAFTFGREQAIPGIFQAVLGAIPDSGSRFSTLSTYLERHIELDGQDHGPKALAMLAALCGDDTLKWQEAALGAREALIARIDFWSCIATEVADQASSSPLRDVASDRVFPSSVSRAGCAPGRAAA